MALIESLAIKAALGTVGGAIKDAFKFVIEHPWQGATIGLAAWVSWLVIFTVPGLEKDLEAEVRTHKLTKQNYTTAMAQAEKRWAEAWQGWEDRYVELAEKADVAEAKARRDFMLTTEQFIAAGGLRCETGASPDGVTGGATGGSTAGTGAESADGPDPVSQLVAVRPTDVRICTENTSRLKAAQDWASGLNKERENE